MMRCRQKGSITVFLSLIGVLMISLVCTLVESARVQGAKAYALAAMDRGLFSVFSEYEKRLLEEYDVFFINGANGEETLHLDKIEEVLQNYTSKSLRVEKNGINSRSFCMYPIEISSKDMSRYQLATDEAGEVFYQQVVKNRKENLGSELIGKLTDEYRMAVKQKEAGEAYEKNDKQIEQRMKELEEEVKQQKKQAESAKETGGEMSLLPASGEAGGEKPLLSASEGMGGETLLSTSGETGKESPRFPAAKDNVEPPENPLDSVKKVKGMGILSLVVKEADGISIKSINTSKLPSARTLEKGNLPVKKTESGMAANGLFQDYLMEHFPNAARQFENQKKKEKKGAENTLDYQIEYILMGKNSDSENLKAVVTYLLLLREGVNFLYAMNNPEMESEALALATLLVGAIPIPGLTSVMKMALLLAWAYGESLLDVRTLLAGGRVPAVKNADTWKLSLQNLGKLTEILEECDSGGGSGQSYEEYLRILLFAAQKENYPMRALDMLEENMRGEEDTKNFKVDFCISSVEAEMKFSIKPLFMHVGRAFLGSSVTDIKYIARGSFSY